MASYLKVFKQPAKYKQKSVYKHVLLPKFLVFGKFNIHSPWINFNQISCDMKKRIETDTKR